MKLKDFLRHHKIERNPFAEEDAQTDPVFKEHCIGSTYHPTWDKVFGNPADPSTSIVFGEKGAGKTALRLQIDRHLLDHNRSHPDARCFVIHYDDFNPFLDRFCERLGRKGRRPNKALLEYRLWDHMDAVLSLGVTQLVDAVLEKGSGSTYEIPPIDAEALCKLDRHQRRDLMLLTACYDNSSAAPFVERWRKLKRRVRFWTIKSWWPHLLGTVITASMFMVLVSYLFKTTQWEWLPRFGDASDNRVPTPVWWAALIGALAGWSPWLFRRTHRLYLAYGSVSKARVLPRKTRQLGATLMRFTRNQLAGQPLPNRRRTDDRYGLLRKFQSILETLGFGGIIVLVDRVDEPNCINGSADLMRAFLWPMLDNKFLKQPGLGIKFMLPSELTQFIDRENREFYQRARLDKQNMIPSLDWTGEALYDVANARLAACATNGAKPRLRDLMDESISDRRLYEVLRSLRVPRHMFRILHCMFVAHCNRHSEDQPEWRIGANTFESELALYNRSLSAADRGLGAG